MKELIAELRALAINEQHNNRLTAALIRAAFELGSMSNPVKVDHSIRVDGGELFWKNTPYYFNPHGHEGARFYPESIVSRLIVESDAADKHTEIATALYDATRKELEELKKFDVRQIMTEIVPGEDGMGEEVYAKSIDDVERLMSDLGLKFEDAYLDNISLKETVKGLCNAISGACHHLQPNSGYAKDDVVNGLVETVAMVEKKGK